MSTTVSDNDTAQFTIFFLVRLNITIATSFNLLNVIFSWVFSSLNVENGLKKYGFVELAVTFFTLYNVWLFVSYYILSSWAHYLITDSLTYFC